MLLSTHSGAASQPAAMVTTDCHLSVAVCSQHGRRNYHLSRFFVNFGACIVFCAAEAWVVLVPEVES